jgi:hypothetical protein
MRRTCHLCYRVGNEDHSWFCIYGSGINPAAAARPEHDSRDDDVRRGRPGDSGGGGGDRGDRNYPEPPILPRPGGTALPRPAQPALERPRPVIDIGEVKRSPLLLETKVALERPADREILELPAPVDAKKKTG